MSFIIFNILFEYPLVSPFQDSDSNAHNLIRTIESSLMGPGGVSSTCAFGENRHETIIGRQ